MGKRRGYDEEPGEILPDVPARPLIIGGVAAAILALMPLRYLAEGPNPGQTVSPAYGVILALCFMVAATGVAAVCLGVVRARRVHGVTTQATGCADDTDDAGSTQPQADSAIQ